MTKKRAVAGSPAGGRFGSRTAAVLSAPDVGTGLPSGQTIAFLNGTVFVGVLALIVITPYFRGLFFPQEQMVTLLVALVLFIARWAAKIRDNDYTFLRSPLDWAVFGVFVAYLASTFVAVKPRAAIQEDIKYLLYFLVYWLVRELARDERRRAMVLGAVAVTGVWVSILGVGAAAGTFHYRGAFEAPRIFSAFQYPNTLAAYLTAAFFSALGLWACAAGRATEGVRADDPWRAAWPTFLIAPALYAILLVFIFTYSRGAWLVFPLGAAAFLVLQERGHRLGSALMLIAAAVSAGIITPGFAAAIQAKTAAGVWGWFVLGLPIALVFNLVILLYARMSRGVRAGALAAGAVAIISGIVLVVAQRGLPADLLSRLGSVSFKDYNAMSRIQWTADAFRIVRDHPLLGAGGSGWEALYHKYQGYNYSSNQVHNHFFQLWVETGTVGLLAYLAMWALVAWVGVRTVRRLVGPERTLLAGAMTAILALVAHSALDFNLSLAAVSVTLWSLAGLAGAQVADRTAAATNRMSQPSPDPRLRLRTGLIVFSLTGVTILAVTSLLSGFLAGQRAVKALDEGHLAEALKGFEEAVARDPFTATFHIDLGQALAKPGADPATMQRARIEMQQGVALDRNNSKLHGAYALYLLDFWSEEEGLREMEEALALNPFEITWYHNLSHVFTIVAEARLSRGDKKGGAELLNRVLALQDEIRTRNARAPQWIRTADRLPTETPTLALRWGEAMAMLGHLAEAESWLKQSQEDEDTKIDSEATAWLAGVAERKGQAAEAAKLWTMLGSQVTEAERNQVLSLIGSAE